MGKILEVYFEYSMTFFRCVQFIACIKMISELSCIADKHRWTTTSGGYVIIMDARSIVLHMDT